MENNKDTTKQHYSKDTQSEDTETQNQYRSSKQDTKQLQTNMNTKRLKMITERQKTCKKKLSGDITKLKTTSYMQTTTKGQLQRGPC